MVIVGEADEEYVRKTLRVGKVLGFSRSNNRQATRRTPATNVFYGRKRVIFSAIQRGEVFPRVRTTPL